MALPSELNWRHLRALAPVASHGSVSAAAKDVNLSQPALTQGIAKLERQLGVPLFDRGPAGVVAREAGMAMATRAQAAMMHLAEATRAATRAGARGFARPEQLMTTTQLHAFLALADAGSFAAAGAATGLSEPALHRAVRDLEQLCAVALTERRGRGLVLTGAGRRLARGVRLAMREIEGGIADLGGAVDRGRLILGAMPLCRALVLPRALAAFVADHPRVIVDVVEGSWRDLVEPLVDGVIDLMIGALRPDPPAGLEQRALFVDRLAVIGRAGHPLAGAAQPALDDLARCGWIVAQPGTPLRLHWDRLFAGHASPAAPIECGSVMVIRGVLRDSDLLTLLSPDQVAMELASGMLATIGAPLIDAERTIGVTTRAGWRPTAMQRDFLRRLDDAAQMTRVLEIE